MLLAVQKVVVTKKAHKMAGHNMLKQFAGDTRKAHWAIISTLVAITFFVYGCDQRFFPVFGHFSSLKGGVEDMDQGICNRLC